MYVITYNTYVHNTLTGRQSVITYSHIPKPIYVATQEILMTKLMLYFMYSKSYVGHVLTVLKDLPINTLKNMHPFQYTWHHPLFHFK